MLPSAPTLIWRARFKVGAGGIVEQQLVADFVELILAAQLVPPWRLGHTSDGGVFTRSPGRSVGRPPKPRATLPNGCPPGCGRVNRTGTRRASRSPPSSAASFPAPKCSGRLSVPLVNLAGNAGAGSARARCDHRRRGRGGSFGLMEVEAGDGIDPGGFLDNDNWNSPADGWGGASGGRRRNLRFPRPRSAGAVCHP